MRRSEFRAFVRDEFGDAYGQVLVHDQVLTDLNDVTAEQALSLGIEPKTVWLALCRQMGVPARIGAAGGLVSSESSDFAPKPRGSE